MRPGLNSIRPARGTGILPGWLRAAALAAVLVAWCASSGLAAATGSASAKPLLEDLHYRVSLLLLKDAARARLTLKQLGPGRYQAEISGEPRGVLRLMTGERRDSYRTEMICRGGRLLPVVYQEESVRRGQRHLKEYRFDHARGRVELWQLKEGKGLVRKWETTLKEEVFDPLSAFYNCRLGAMGQVRDGTTFKVAGIPYPHPEQVEIRIGPETKDGRKALISLGNQVTRSRAEETVVFAFFDSKGVPTQAWTSTSFGKITSELLPESTTLQDGLPEVHGARTAGTG
jgi:hypothetical protein